MFFYHFFEDFDQAFQSKKWHIRLGAFILFAICICLNYFFEDKIRPEKERGSGFIFILAFVVFYSYVILEFAGQVRQLKSVPLRYFCTVVFVIFSIFFCLISVALILDKILYPADKY